MTINKKNPGIPRLKIDYIRKEFKKANYELLTKRYINSKQLLRFKCGKCKTSRQICWNNFSKGHRCSKCYYDGLGKNTKRKIILRKKHYDMTQAAKILRVTYNDFWHHVRVLGTLPAPTRQLGVKQYYNDADLKKIESMIE